MLDLERPAKPRFGMSEVPKIGGQPGTYEEKWDSAFWNGPFSETSCTGIPGGRKKGQELADAVVLFDDVVLIVQINAQCGRHDPTSWAMGD
jgi:hypothetical protein